MSEEQDVEYRLSCEGSRLTWRGPSGLSVSVGLQPKRLAVLRAAAPLALSATVQVSEGEFVMILVEDNNDEGGLVRLAFQCDDFCIQSTAMRRVDLAAILGGIN